MTTLPKITPVTEAQVRLASLIARLAHEGQTYGDDEPYYDAHVAKVAAYAREFSPDHECVAWLHDTFEDSPLRPDDLTLLGFPPHIVHHVTVISHLPKNTPNEVYWMGIVESTRPSNDNPYPGPWAYDVKLRCDVRHNAETTETSEPGELRDRRTAKYAKARRFLIDARAVSDALDDHRNAITKEDLLGAIHEPGIPFPYTDRSWP